MQRGFFPLRLPRPLRLTERIFIIAETAPRSSWYPPVVVMTGVLLFILLGFIYRTPSGQQVDLHLFDAIHRGDYVSHPPSNIWIDELIRDATALGGMLILTTFTCLFSAYLASQRKKHLAVFLIATVLSGVAASAFLKEIYQRPRPPAAGHRAIVSGHSFPSGHAMISTFTYLTLASVFMRHRQRKGEIRWPTVAAITVASAIGLSRIALGVHWPIDVLAGWIAGATWFVGCGYLMEVFDRSSN